MIIPAVHEYVGFLYDIDIDRNGSGQLRAYPREGQHPAASKEKHRRAAVETFLQEHGEG